MSWLVVEFERFARSRSRIYVISVCLSRILGRCFGVSADPVTASAYLDANAKSWLFLSAFASSPVLFRSGCALIAEPNPVPGLGGSNLDPGTWDSLTALPRSRDARDAPDHVGSRSRAHRPPCPSPARWSARKRQRQLLRYRRQLQPPRLRHRRVDGRPATAERTSAMSATGPRSLRSPPRRPSQRMTCWGRQSSLRLTTTLCRSTPTAA